VHVPYFDFIEDADGAASRLPRGRDIVVMCAQGGSSAMVVEMLREAGVAARNVTGGMVAYGEFLSPVRVRLDADEAARGELWQVIRRGKGCLSYVIRAGADAVVVDPSRDLEWYERFVSGLGARLVRVLDTHVHADHLSGGPGLAGRAGVPYYVAAGSDSELRHAIAPLADDEQIALGAAGGTPLPIRVLATPGHTPGSTSYLVGRRHLLTGDTLFVHGVGRPDLGGHVDEWGRALFHTLRERLATLPGDTVILPAHFAGAEEIGADGVVAGQLADIMRAAPELRIGSEAAFVAAMRAALTPPPTAYTEIARANLGLTTVDKDKATEWELGKNQCAASRPASAA
jgi:glyoxylase-like metal-dependent hydrolase (beta-lactamase superfamily II)